MKLIYESRTDFQLVIQIEMKEREKFLLFNLIFNIVSVYV